MSTDTSYITGGHDADLVKTISDYAMFLFKKGESYTAPTSVQWTPGEAQPIGYNSEDGAVLHPETGDETEIRAHNGDTVLSRKSGGYWTLQFSALEVRKKVAEAYFGVTLEADNAIKLNTVETNQEWSIVLACIDQNGEPMILHAKKAQVSDREDVSLVNTDVIKLGMTFKLFKDEKGNFAELFGFVKDKPKA